MQKLFGNLPILLGHQRSASAVGRELPRRRIITGRHLSRNKGSNFGVRSMLSGIRVCTLALIGVIMLAHLQMVTATEYRDLPLSTYGVSDSKITLVIEKEILIPELTQLQM